MVMPGDEEEQPASRRADTDVVSAAMERNSSERRRTE